MDGICEFNRGSTTRVITAWGSDQCIGGISRNWTLYVTTPTVS